MKATSGFDKDPTGDGVQHILPDTVISMHKLEHSKQQPRLEKRCSRLAHRYRDNEIIGSGYGISTCDDWSAKEIVDPLIANMCPHVPAHSLPTCARTPMMIWQTAKDFTVGGNLGARISNRLVRWTETGLGYETDPRQVGGLCRDFVRRKEPRQCQCRRGLPLNRRSTTNPTVTLLSGRLQLEATIRLPAGPTANSWPKTDILPDTSHL